MWVIHYGSMQADLLIYLYVSHSSWQYASRLIDIPICESFIMTVCKQTYWNIYMSHSSWQYASRLIDIPICESFIVAVCKQTYWYTYMWVIHHDSMQADLLIYLYVNHSSWQYASRLIDIPICESFIMAVCKQTYWYTYMWVTKVISYQIISYCIVYCMHTEFNSLWYSDVLIVPVPLR